MDTVMKMGFKTISTCSNKSISSIWTKPKTLFTHSCLSKMRHNFPLCPSHHLDCTIATLEWLCWCRSHPHWLVATESKTQQTQWARTAWLQEMTQRQETSAALLTQSTEPWDLWANTPEVKCMKRTWTPVHPVRDVGYYSFDKLCRFCRRPEQCFPSRRKIRSADFHVKDNLPRVQTVQCVWSPRGIQTSYIHAPCPCHGCPRSSSLFDLLDPQSSDRAHPGAPRSWFWWFWAEIYVHALCVSGLIKQPTHALQEIHSTHICFTSSTMENNSEKPGRLRTSDIDDTKKIMLGVMGKIPEH